ncbi:MULTISPECIES: DUF4148 domain-containing protein [Caballeronia]|uniref:DUF4148 domain-containing protein n=1 Tax=Caballeronia TaxID=1827195 RepID=UPI000A7742E8
MNRKNSEVSHREVAHSSRRIAAVLTAPVASFAQSDLLVTRKYAELAQLEKAGYSPARGSDLYYPADIQIAALSEHNREFA